MSKISIEGNASGTGTLTIAAPNTNSNRTLNLPDASGTMVVTGGAQTIEFAAGTAGAPSITTTGDINTGIFFPAADTIGFAEGGAEAMRIDSSGNVGIGTTSEGAKLHVVGTTGVRIDGGLGNTAVLGLTSGATPSDGSSISATYDGSGSYGPLKFLTGDTERARITSGGDFQFNSGYGSVATAYGCRAWVNFNGTGTPAIREDGNVSSITDNGNGNYTVNFTTAMPDANYAVVMTAGDTSSGTCLFQSPFNTSPTTSAAQVLVTNSAFTATDRPFVQVAIFR